MRVQDTYLVAVVGAVMGYLYGSIEGALIGLLLGFVAARILFEKQGLRGLFR